MNDKQYLFFDCYALDKYILDGRPGTGSQIGVLSYKSHKSEI